jgi:hypothetical protein
MGRIALDSSRAPILDSNEHPTGIGAIMRTSGVNNFLHDPCNYKVNAKNKSRVLTRGLRSCLLDYFISITSFSFPLLNSSIFLISSSVSR